MSLGIFPAGGEDEYEVGEGEDAVNNHAIIKIGTNGHGLVWTNPLMTIDDGGSFLVHVHVLFIMPPTWETSRDCRLMELTHLQYSNGHCYEEQLPEFR